MKRGAKRAALAAHITESAYFHSYIENGLFIILLAFWPLIHVGEGLDVADAVYSLGNFQYFTSAKGTWQVATYLSNVLGWLLMKLPRGGTMAGMNLYTGLLVSVTAVGCYLALRRRMSSIVAFAGEMLAVSLCWCPTVILYHYLSYCLMTMGAWLLYRGCLGDVQGKARGRYLTAAGVCLGANIAVRMPNVVQAAFILVLWYSAFLQKEALRDTVRDTLRCLAGYAAGFAVPFAAICVQYGAGAYPEMVSSLFGMTDQATDYKPGSMVTGMLADYGHGLYWLAFAAVCMAGLYVVCLFCRMLAVRSLQGRELPGGGEAAPAGGRLYVWAAALACLCAWGVMLRFYWGRGMFHFQYWCHDYRSVYWWAVLFLLAGIAGALWLLADRGGSVQDRTLALLILLQIFLTPLGSNNKLMPIINNLFLTAPFTLWCGQRLWRRADGAERGVTRDSVGEGIARRILHLPWRTLLLVFGVTFAVQCVGFHREFVFGDGIWGEARDTRVTEPAKAAGILTNRENEECLAQLADYVLGKGLSGRETILYGEIPGVGYLLDMPCAISTTWPDLDSYPAARMERDMKAVEADMGAKRPVVIMSAETAARYDLTAHGGGEAARETFDAEQERGAVDSKAEILFDFLADYGYEETYMNPRYAVYE